MVKQWDHLEPISNHSTSQRNTECARDAHLFLLLLMLIFLPLHPSLQDFPSAAQERRQEKCAAKRSSEGALVQGAPLTSFLHLHVGEWPFRYLLSQDKLEH